VLDTSAAELTLAAIEIDDLGIVGDPARSSMRWCSRVDSARVLSPGTAARDYSSTMEIVEMMYERLCR
jgi:hypothetical protein